MGEAAVAYERLYPSGAETIATAHTDDWYAARALHVGASEVAAVMGESEHEDAIAVWMRKTGRTPEKRSNVQMRKGNLLEELVLDLAAEKLSESWEGVEVSPCGVMVRDPEEPRLASTPDGVVYIEGDHRGPGLIEAKYTGLRIWEWKEKYGGEPDLAHQLQLQTQLACTGYRWGVIAVLPERTDEPLLFEYDAHEGAIAAIRASVREFWGYVERDETPPAASPAALRAVKALYPRDSGGTVDLPDEAAEWDRRLAEIKASEKALRAERDEIEARICAAIGEATFGRIPGGGRFKHAVVKRGGYTVAPTEYRQLRRLAK